MVLDRLWYCTADCVVSNCRLTCTGPASYETERASVLSGELLAGGKTEEYFHVWLEHSDAPPEGYSRQLASLKNSNTWS